MLLAFVLHVCFAGQCEKLRQELEQLKAAANLSKQQAVAKPKPVPKRLQKHGKSKQDEPQSEEESCASDEAEPEEEVESEDERELSEAAKKQRLRSLPAQAFWKAFCPRVGP